MSRVHSPAASPYSVSFARAATSSRSSNGIATSTGPKISSRAIFMSSETFVNRVGLMK